VQVTPSDTSALRVALDPVLASTDCITVTFQYKVKKNAPVGTFQIVFTGRDPTGATRSAIMFLVIRQKASG